MMGYDYHAGPCPMCGEEHAARMSRSTWGHHVLCCSDACGEAYCDSTQRWEAELASWIEQRKEAKRAIKILRKKLRKAHKAAKGK